ncbi:LytTR family DNA-binding domain-containing protein [Chryseobacterium sp. 2987]|uniref:LytR/AlgR family response regulator transcription factor n=1 Tax=Chryseobacterium sp. 2987 TaxID=2817767 RepID=UPI00285C5A7D|nr:LytTR family DNA-binding domain-containing protein [Chryseobacterium sp. 2987]MDR6919396.1 DNA-binding LytR/AlgR family response regulator [Chryseobacterium sp. 2987]
MKQKINCIILDDEPFAVRLLNDYALKTGVLNVIYAGSDVYEVMKILRSESIDLIFIDIQMPELTGIEMMKMFNKNHNFIVTTAYAEYALEAFDFHVVDFLLKPIVFNRFYQSVEKFIQWQQAFAPSPQTEYLLVRADRKYYKIAFEEIVYIEGLKDYIRIHTVNDKVMMLENMKDILEKLPENRFMRIHRSYIIATDKIKVIEGNRIQMRNLDFVTVGETYRKPFSDWIESNGM